MKAQVEVKSPMFVIAMVGPTGSGKTTIVDGLNREIRELAKRDWSRYLVGEPDIHKEGYMGSNAVRIGRLQLGEIDNSLIISKMNYLAAWLNSMRYKRALGKGLVISDRCPYDVASYVDDTEVLLALASAIRKDLETLGILLRTVFVSSEASERKRRVGERLQWEPDRLQYKEDNNEFQERTARFFADAEKKGVWDEMIDNNGTEAKAVKSAKEAITRILQRERS